MKGEFLGNIFNRRIKKHIFDSAATLIIGSKRVGKSTLLALYCEEFIKSGVDVYCQFPYEGAFQIPLISVRDKKTGLSKMYIDKDWLYTADLSNSVVMIDEAAEVWPARSYATWTASDTEFFVMNSHHNTTLILATQNYDFIDVNVRRSCDETMFITRSTFFPHLNTIECSRTVIQKVSDNRTEVVGLGFKRGYAKVNWDLCELPLGVYRFYRKPYYGNFFTHYTLDEKPKIPTPNWNTMINFKTGEVIEAPEEVNITVEKGKEYDFLLK